MKENKALRYIVFIYPILMCMQYILLEGGGISYIKVAAMALAIPLTIIYTPFISKATVWAVVLLGAVMLSAIVINSNYRSSTIYYFALFLITFNMYYGLVYKNKLSVDYYIKLLKGLILAYVLCLLVQQLTNLVGIGKLPIINKYFFSAERGIFTGNSLSLEPSHSARIMAIAFFAFLKTSQIKNGTPLSLRQLFVENRWLTLGFLWSMTTMGSGTAYVALGILSLYFIRKEYIMFIIPASVVLYFTIPYIDNFSLNRARNVVEVVVTGDTKDVKKTDGSAAIRINPILNTFKNLDITSSQQWFGEGTDTGNKRGILSDKNQMGIINDYGLLAFIIGCILIYSCCITRFFSLETLMILLLLSFNAANIAYVWGCYMLLVPMKYFYKKTNAQIDE